MYNNFGTGWLYELSPGKTRLVELFARPLAPQLAPSLARAGDVRPPIRPRVRPYVRPPANPSCGFQHIHGSEFLSLANLDSIRFLDYLDSMYIVILTQNLVSKSGTPSSSVFSPAFSAWKDSRKLEWVFQEICHKFINPCTYFPEV